MPAFLFGIIFSETAKGETDINTITKNFATKIHEITRKPKVKNL